MSRFDKSVQYMIALGLMFYLPMSTANASGNYYVDNSGNDTNPGTAGSPWQHVGYALRNVSSGSTIYLTSGQTFVEDNVTLSNKSGLLVSASGAAPAILRNATTGTNQFGMIAFEQGIPIGRDVLAVVNSSAITLSNLCFYGTGPSNSANWACINIMSINYGYCTNISVLNCETTNANFGISIYATGNTPLNMFGNLTLVGNRIHEIGYDGILEWSYYADQVGAIYCSNAITANNEVYNVTGRPDLNSGTGIAFFNVSHWECFSNFVHDCGQNQGLGGGGGAGGIFPVFYSDHVHIWHNEVARIWSKPQGDGVGIDLDRGTQNSIVEGNFVHDCGGAGYYSYQAYGNNIWRWNLGVNDGNGISNPNFSPAGHAAEMWFNDYHYIATNSSEWIYNNTLIGSGVAFNSTDDELIPNSALILNNIFGTLSTNFIGLISEDLPVNGYPQLGTNWYFSGNNYDPAHFFIEWPNGTTNLFFNLSQWQQYGQEIGTGSTNNPMFCVGTGSIASNYLLLATSPLRGKSLNVQQLYGLSPGILDFLGNSPSSSGGSNNVGGLAGLAGSGSYYYLTVSNGSGNGNYAFGQTASISANAEVGISFANWSGPNIASSNQISTTVTIYSNTAVTANYIPSPATNNWGITNGLNVTDYGAVGNAAMCFVHTVANSSVINTTNQLSSADIGKLIEIFAAGPLGTSTNHQDFVAVITGIVNSTNIYLDRPCGATITNAYAIFGNNNASAFQACINAAPSNSVVEIPNGIYLIIGSQVLDTNFVCSNPYETHPSIVINKGGLTLLGQNRTNTVLMGCGAWQNKGAWAYRGYMFACQGPVTNNGPLIFDNFTMDGGVQQGYTGITAFPASTATGDGWDVTHDAVIDVGLPPLHNVKIFRNCTITRWRGEQVKSVTSGWDGFISITNCSFGNGDASGINFNFTHDINNCRFENLFETMEFYQGYYSNTCYFRNCTVTNVGALMAINGASATRATPPYIICNNTFLPGYANGIQTTPANNVIVSNNLFMGGGFPLAFGVLGYQGTALNSNIVVTGNIFSNTWTPIEVEGSGQNSLVNLLVSNNIAYGAMSHLFAETESGGWGTNMIFVRNFTTNFGTALVSVGMSGQYFLDDDSNVFPPHQIFGSSAANEIGYEYGQRHLIWSAQTNSFFFTDDTHSNQIPVGAKLCITNLAPLTLPLYLSSSLSGTPIQMTNGFGATFSWNAKMVKWMPSGLTAPSNLRIIESY